MDRGHVLRRHATEQIETCFGQKVNIFLLTELKYLRRKVMGRCSSFHMHQLKLAT